MLRKIKILIPILIFVFCTTYSSAQETKLSNIIEIEWANDVWMETDYYFSNGLEFRYYNSFMQKSPTAFVLLPNKNGETVYHGITLTQHFFTPIVATDSISVNDHPFASYLLLGHRKISFNPNKRIKKQSEIQFGLLGRYSGGESIQNWIHELLPNSSHVSGWNNQLRSSPALNYLMKFEHGIFNTRSFDLMSVMDLRMGIPYTDVGAGLKMRFGRFTNYFSNIGIDSKKGWQLYLFAEADVKYIAYNAVLQGGFGSRVYIINDLKSVIFQSHIGIVFTINRFGVELGQHFKSPEFNAGLPHAWGYMTFRFVFKK